MFFFSPLLPFFFIPFSMKTQPHCFFPTCSSFYSYTPFFFRPTKSLQAWSVFSKPEIFSWVAGTATIDVIRELLPKMIFALFDNRVNFSFCHVEGLKIQKRLKIQNYLHHIIPPNQSLSITVCRFFTREKCKNINQSILKYRHFVVFIQRINYIAVSN